MVSINGTLLFQFINFFVLVAILAKFKQISDEKMTDLKRSSDSKRSGGYSRRGGGRQ